jgi:hypothetical protein
MVALVFFAAVTFLIEPLPNNDKGIQIQAHGLMGGDAAEIGSSAITHIKKFHQDWLSHYKVDRRDTRTQTKW